MKDQKYVIELKLLQELDQREEIMHDLEMLMIKIQSATIDGKRVTGIGYFDPLLPF